MLDETDREALEIPIILDGPSGGAAFADASGPRLRLPPVDRQKVEVAEGIATLGLYDFIAHQFSMPAGLCGHVTGALMGLINHLPNRHAVKLLDIQDHDDVLEMGFGPGWALKKMAKLARSGTVTGVDWSPTMFRQAQARNRAAIRNGKLKLIHGTFERLPLESASVDKILAVNVIYFWSPGGPVLAEAHRVLRPGGMMSIYATDCTAMKRLQFIGPETQQIFDRKGLEVFLGKSPFGSDHVDIQTIGLSFGFRGLVARLRKR